MISFVIPHRIESLGIVCFLNHLVVINKKLNFSNKLNFVFVSDGRTNFDYSSLIYNTNSFYFISNDKKSGASACRNIGLKFILNSLKETRHVIFFDDDDFIPFSTLEYLTKKKFDRSSSFFLNYFISNKFKYKAVDYRRVLLPHKFVYAYNIYGPPFRHLISIDRIIEKSLIWDEFLISCQDWDFYVNLYSDDYKPKLINDIFLQYNESLSGITKDVVKTLNGRVAFYNKHLTHQESSLKFQFYLNSLLFFVKRNMLYSAFIFYKRLKLKFEPKFFIIFFTLFKRI